MDFYYKMSLMKPLGFLMFCNLSFFKTLNERKKCPITLYVE